jgi:TRAP-type mannitol/chloroaromatic compound transport system permease small subunit
MNEHSKFAVSAAVDVSKQVMALATGVIAIQVTFIKDLPIGSGYYAELSWFFLLISILFGLLTLMGVAGTVAKSDEIRPDLIYKKHLRIVAAAQILFFFLGIVSSVFFAFISVGQSKRADEKKEPSVSFLMLNSANQTDCCPGLPQLNKCQKKQEP